MLECNSGSAMVEAVFIYPIVVCTAVLLVWMTVMLFQSICIETSMSHAMRAAAGSATDTVLYEKSAIKKGLYLKPGAEETEKLVCSDFDAAIRNNGVGKTVGKTSVDYHKGLVFDSIEMCVSGSFSGGGIISYSSKKKYFGVVSVTDEAALIDIIDLLPGE